MNHLTSENEKEWLVMIYIAADDVRKEDIGKQPPAKSIEDSCQKFLDNLEMLDIDSGNVHLVALYDDNNIGDTSKRQASVLERVETGWKNKNDDIKTDPYYNIFIPEEGKVGRDGIDSGYYLTLAAFVRWATINYKAKCKVLAIIGHGGGWAPTVRKKWPDKEIGEAPFSQIWLKNGANSPGLNGVCVDESSGTAISTKELRMALRQGLHHNPNLQKPGVHETIDILFLDACLMSMVEVSYELQDYVEYLVAGENLMIATLAYQDCFGRAVLKKETAVEDLARAFVDRYSPGSAAPWIISAIEVSKIPTIVESLNQLAVNLSDMIRTDDIVIQCVRSAYTSAQKLDYRARKVILETRDGYVDLRDFLSHLKDEITILNIDGKLQDEIHVYEEKAKRDPGDKEIIHVLKALIDALSKQMKDFSKNKASVIDTIHKIDTLIGQCVYTRLNPESQSNDLRRARGLSIYLPLGEDDDRNNDKTTTQLGGKKHPMLYAEDLLFTLDASEWRHLLIETLISKLGKTPVEELPFHTPQLLLP